MVYDHANKATFKAIKEALDQFCEFIGMTINRQRSGIAFLKSCIGREELIRIEEPEFLVKYLGILLTLNKLKHTECGSSITSLERTLMR